MSRVRVTESALFKSQIAMVTGWEVKQTLNAGSLKPTRPPLFTQKATYLLVIGDTLVSTNTVKWKKKSMQLSGFS